MKTRLAAWLLLCTSSVSWAQAEQDAERILQALQLQQTTPQVVEALIEYQIMLDPNFKAYAEVMRAFAQRYLTWEALHEIYLSAYLAEYNEAELKQLAEFLQTPVGRKYLSRGPAVNERISAQVQRLLQTHQAELQRMIVDHELQQR